MRKIATILLIMSTITILLIGLLTSCSNNKSKLKDLLEQQDPMAIPQLIDRTGPLANATEWSKTKEKIAELNEKLKTNPNDVKTRLQIATIFIAEQRITGEHHHYYPAIEKILKSILSIQPNNFEAKVYMASLKMSQHQFAEAKKLAQEAKAINPNNAYVYGILVDANVELGDYATAVAMSDSMQKIKPSLESYSRASYLREIYGDYNGAIAAMQLAVQAGLPASEPQCWSRNILGDLYFDSNKITEAEKAYAENLAMRPSYAPSMAGMAKVAAHQKNYAKAIALLDSAIAIMPNTTYEEQKADVYSKMGDAKKATELYSKVQKTLTDDANSAHHSVALELAKCYIKTNGWDSAKKYAMQEFNTRPKNIEVNNVLAWIAYQQKDIANAKMYMTTALTTGNKNPELLQRATIINGK